jgi:hypothetical protein
MSVKVSDLLPAGSQVATAPGGLNWSIGSFVTEYNQLSTIVVRRLSRAPLCSDADQTLGVQQSQYTSSMLTAVLSDSGSTMTTVQAYSRFSGVMRKLSSVMRKTAMSNVWISCSQCALLGGNL